MSDIKFPELPILHVDDEHSTLKNISFRLSTKGINNILQCQDSRQVIPMLEKQDYSLVLLDLRMPYISGEELLPQIAGKFPHIPVIMVTSDNDTSIIVSCLKNGAYDYITKPVDDNRLVSIIHHALEKRNLENEKHRLQESFFSDKLENPSVFKDIITRATKVQKIFQFIETVGPYHVPVLITGETGTGKEKIAEAIHNIAKIKGKVTGKFVKDNVAGWTDTLFDDILFGHLKHSFSDAKHERKGRLKEAHDGTLFLDEIGDLEVNLQIKLLRLLQEKKFYPIGSDEEQVTNARFIFATNKDINELKNKGKFREDLFFRLNPHHIHLPALRERKEDIPELVRYFVRKYAVEFSKPEPSIPETLYNILLNYPFPGNIRELQGMVEAAMTQHKQGELGIDIFVKTIRERNIEPIYTPPKNSFSISAPEDHSILFGGDLPDYKKLMAVYTNEALRRTNGDKSKASRKAGLSRSTFIRYWKDSNSPETKIKKSKKRLKKPV